MLLKPRPCSTTATARPSFSTLYRVDAIEARLMAYYGRMTGALSVPSIGSMLLKHNRGQHRLLLDAAFQYPLSGRCY